MMRVYDSELKEKQLLHFLRGFMKEWKQIQ